MRCSKCNEDKSESEFTKANNWRGYQGYCKVCFTKYRKTPQARLNRNRRRKKKRLSDEVYRLKTNMRSRTWITMNRITTSPRKYRTFDWIGCEPDELLVHLILSLPHDKKHHYLSCPSCYHVDHIKPLALAKTEDEVRVLTHYTNLQLLLAEDNLKKSDTYDINREEDVGTIP